MDFFGFKIFYSGIFFWVRKCGKYFLGGLGPVHTYTPSLTENEEFFWLTVLTYPFKMVTENASLQILSGVETF